MKKRVLAVLLTLVLVVGVMPMTASASSGGQKTGEVAVKYFIQEAKAATFGFNDEWCGMFIYRCAEEAGESAAMGGSMSNMAYVYTAANWFAVNATQFGVFSDAALNDIRNHGGYNVNSSHRMNITNYKPQIGDIVFYDWNSYGTDIDHVEIVTDYSANGLYSIGGNRGSGHWSVTKVNGQSCALDTTNKLCAITAFARPNYSDTSKPTTSNPTPTPSAATSKPTQTKTQYRYHRYEDNKGEYAVCAYWGNVTYNTTMHIAYSDWLDAPLPEVKQGYVNYLEHPNQGAACSTAGCLSSDPFEVHRHVDASGKVWYYEETRTVTAEATPTPTPAPSPDPTPNCDKEHTWGNWETVTEATCEAAGKQEQVCEVCGETETKTIAALEHDYRVKQETDTSILYVCRNCGDSYMEDKWGFSLDGGLPFQPIRTYDNGLFRDVKSGDWFSSNVATAYSMGLMNGTGGSSFSPGNNVTLAEVVTLAARIHSIYYNGGERFATYDGGNWYDPYVDYARENSIIDTNYAYSRPATREEVVHILARALPEEELENTVGRVSFADSGDITYMADVRLLSGAGVINGIQENGLTYFKPLSPITRAEVAAVVGRMVRPDTRVGK